MTALSLAILFVALALILNTAIYTENLATRGGDIGGGTDAVRYHDAARVGVGGLVDYVNEHNHTSQAALQSNLTAGIEAFRDQSARLFAGGNRGVEVAYDSYVPGARLAQTDPARNFSNVSGTDDWTAAGSVGHVRAVRFHVDRTDLAALPNPAFKLVLDDGSATWSVAVGRDQFDTEVVVEVDGPSTSGTCSVAAADAWINVTEGTLAGEACSPLDGFGDGLAPTYDVRFENGSLAAGTYSLVVDDDALAASPGPHLAAEGAGQPFAAHAVYATNVTVAYETPRLSYNTTVRVAPGEAGG